MRIDNDLSNKSIMSFVMGCINIFLWLLPIVAIFTSIYGVYIGFKGIDSEQRRLSIAGISLGVISFVFSFIRSGFVFFS